MNPRVESFYDPPTFTFTYVVYDTDGGHAAIVDPLLDYDAATARTENATEQAYLRRKRDA